MNTRHICGVDEVGRGTLAGPVVASAVILQENHKILHEIQTVQNQIRLDQIKVKIKAKIQNQNLFVRNF